MVEWLNLKLKKLETKNYTMATYVIGDIHGQVKALEKCLELSGFDMENVKLICLGDVCDRGDHVKESFDLLLKIKNLVYVLGNHDTWFLDWAVSGTAEYTWEVQYGEITQQNYKNGVPQGHIDLLQNAKMFHLEDERLFVHAGIDIYKPLEEQTEYDLLWNRDLVNYVFRISSRPVFEMKKPFKEIFVGHTPTVNYGSEKPIYMKGVWMLDTGAGWGHKLTIMDIETKEFWQAQV
jgi:serine/threonine protein phosphatase 1